MLGKIVLKYLSAVKCLRHSMDMKCLSIVKWGQPLDYIQVATAQIKRNASTMSSVASSVLGNTPESLIHSSGPPRKVGIVYK